MAHVIIIGAGLGGVPAAFDLRKHLPRIHQVTLIGARPYFEFTPPNPWHLAKIAFEKYFMRKVRTGSLAPVYETYVLKALGIMSLKRRAS